MKKSYEVFAGFIRWIVAGVISFIIVLPALVSFTLDA